MREHAFQLRTLLATESRHISATGATSDVCQHCPGDLDLLSNGPSRASFPLRGLLYSVVIHALAFTASLLVPWDYWLPSPIQIETAERIIHEHEVLVLPNLSPRQNESGALSSAEVNAVALRANTRPIPIYKGPQVIISNPPKPDNYIQTIRQPDLVKPPRILFPMALPNLVLVVPPPRVLPVAVQKPVPAPPTIPQNASKFRVPQIDLAVAAPVPPPPEPPRLPLQSSRVLPVPTATAPLPPREPTAAVQPPPPAVETADGRNLVVVSPVPAPAKPDLVIPPGELRGAFAISPDPTANVAKPTITSAPAPAKPNPTTNSSGSSNPGQAGGAATGKAANAVSGTGSGTVTGAGKGANSGTNRAEPVRSSSGPAPGTTLGAGSGGGTFDDLVISGGTSKTGRVSGTHVTPSPPKPNYNYGITIVGSGASGGGFKDYGVFRNEAVYTIYLDMRDAGDIGPNWTMQYALLRKPDTGLTITGGTSSQGVLTPPFPMNKEIPQIPPEFAGKRGGGTVVVYAVITPEGRVEDVRILSTPMAAFNKSVIDTIRHWSFRPAELDGKGVPVKVLLGVPIDALAPAHSSG